jgi:tripartite ATP-independent transporter DctM subunit
MIAFLIVLIIGLPISFSMLLIGAVGIAIYTSPAVALDSVSLNLLEQFGNFNYLVIPMYMFMGYLAAESGLGQKFFNTANKWIGHLPGGLAMAAQAACAVFGAISGCIFATTSVGAGAIIGVLIPPSIILMLYGIITQNPIKTLFRCAIIPGIMLMVLNMITIYILVKRDPDLAPRAAKSSWKERFESLSGGVWQVVVIFLLSLGGLFAGLFTPTEAGAVGAAGVLIVTLVTRELKWEGIKNALMTTSRSVAMVMLLIGTAMVFGRFLALSGLPAKLANLAGSLPLPPAAIMSVIMFAYLILGCFIDVPALVLMTVPVLYPIVINILGYDPIWFGVMMIMVQGMGVLTPPVGMVIYVVKDLAKDVPLEEIFKGVWPFILTLVVLTAILIVFPQIVTFAK